MTVFERAGRSGAGAAELRQPGRHAGRDQRAARSARAAGGPPNIWTARTMFDVAILVADAMRDIERRDGAHLEKQRAEVQRLVHPRRPDRAARPCGSSASMPRATSSRPAAGHAFFQTGEAKYGKPIIDRAIDPSHQPERRDQVRAGLVRLDDAQQPVGRHAHRPALLRARRARRCESAAASMQAIPTSARSARNGARASAPPSRSCPSRSGRLR